MLELQFHDQHEARQELLEKGAMETSAELAGHQKMCPKQDYDRFLLLVLFSSHQLRLKLIEMARVSDKNEIKDENH